MAKLNLLSTNGSYFRLLLTFSFFLAASVIPVIGGLFVFTLPQVIFVLSVLNNPRKTLGALLVPLAVISVILFLIQSALPALALIIMALSGIVMTWAMKKNYSIESIILLPSLLIMAAVIAYFIFGAMNASITPWQFVEQTVRQAVEINISLYSRLPLSPDEIKSIADNKASVIQIFTQIFPALCTMTILFMVWFNMIASKKILLKSGIIPAQFINLVEWKAPTWLVWIFLATGGMLLIPYPQVNFAGANAFLSVSFIYLLQGLAIVSFFFQQKGVSPFFRGFFYFFVAIQQILMIAIALLGLFDIWMDFRKFFRNNPASDENT